MTETWWRHGVIYQIYPRSFQDSNDDGIGDLQGIITRLDYLQWLQIDAIWISPFYPSPMADFGYDVADYCDVDPIFGDLACFRRLLAEAHQRSIKVILDLVPNHSSEQHPWFIDSRSSRMSPKRDWYIWRDGRGLSDPPNNWISNFGGSAWTWDAQTSQYYFHAFLKEQPDLNWRNRDVRAAIYDVMRFWLDLGVDGFRVDVLWHLMKDAALRDNPPNPSYAAGQPDINRLLQIYSADQPEMAEVVAEMRHVMDQYPDRVLIGEIYLPFERLVSYYGKDLSGVHLPFNFQLLFAAWTARSVRALIDDYERALPPGAWPNWVLGNHDQKRIATRIGLRQARVAAMLLLTLRGTPTLYYGDEIGMHDVAIPADFVRDPWEKAEPGLGLGRDPQRTPMQWDASANAGFSRRSPWLPVAPDFRETNVASARSDPCSMLSLYRKLLSLRRTSRVLTHGTYRAIDLGDDVLGYERVHDGQRLMIALNFGQEARTVTINDGIERRILLTTHGPSGERFTRYTLQSDEGIIAENIIRTVRAP